MERLTVFLKVHPTPLEVLGDGVKMSQNRSLRRPSVETFPGFPRAYLPQTKDGQNEKMSSVTRKNRQMSIKVAHT